MTRAVFDWAESPGTALREAPNVLATQFGDGYSQRQPNGLNPIAQEWDMRFTAADDAHGTEIVGFFRSHGGWKSFDWTPRWATTPIQVICPQWSRSQPSETGISDISAKFVQVFEP